MTNKDVRELSKVLGYALAAKNEGAARLIHRHLRQTAINNRVDGSPDVESIRVLYHAVMSAGYLIDKQFGPEDLDSDHTYEGALKKAEATIFANMWDQLKDKRRIY